MSHPGVLLDRDGVINQRRPTLVRTPEQLRILPGVPEAVAQLTAAGYRIAVTTNQRPVAYGIIDPADLAAIHDRIEQRIEEAGGRIDRFYACTHGFREPCPCGKPRPGMLEEAARDLDLDPSRSWMLGDKGSDIKAGQAFGARTIWITGSRFPWDHLRREPPADFRARTLSEAVARILLEDEDEDGDPPERQRRVRKRPGFQGRREPPA